MKLKFCGAAGTTTGSQHLLEINGTRILLDCGLYQGHREDSYEVNCCFPHFDPKEIDVVILSHAHIDHSGNLPNLSKQGFTGNIYTTFATRDLCQIMLADSAHIQEQDTEWLNKDRKKDGLPPVEPLYVKEDAERCLRQFVTMDYERPMPVADGVTVTFFDAGHILGAAQVLLEIIDKEDSGKKKRFLFSGDVGRGGNEILRDPVAVPDVDFVLMESTYGGREHELPTGSIDAFGDVLNRAIRRGGKILIPAFAVERTQQLLYLLNQLFHNDRLRRIPVYVDSPLAVNATEIFRIHPECFNDTVYRFLFDESDPFIFDGLRLVRAVTESKKLNDVHEPCIIISASGMCEAGRIRHHLKNNLGDPRTTVLFVGYCADHTLGRAIRDGRDVVNIFGKPVKVRAVIEAIDSFSGHADHSELLDWFHRMTGPKKRVWLVHGEPDRSNALRDALANQHDGDVDVAVLGETVEI
ncbi:MBL fold metallo-hydrolase RNA specificity domain-containing protein [Luteolibacter marinus]|uniref:MBL fold metallo-hydrolase RNA specificity domain-containing protein n=1 Tax=Luteolibacter marinus TaxID=2776705 RepID=UPI001867947A|nr:MBL fold metallo-hydrolase [Luteolibacter marinus]